MAYNVPLYRRGGSPKALYAGFVQTAAILVLSAHILAMTPAESHSQEINYDGKDPSVLQVTPTWAGGELDSSLFPDASPAEESSGNKITIDYDPMSGAARPNSVFGGLSESKNATDNTVIVINGEITGLLRGGFAHTGDALRNTVIIHGGDFKNVIDGGYSYSRSAERNMVTIRGGAFAENISGGRTDGGNAIYNTVTLLGGTVSGDVSGGRTKKGTAANNTVTVSGGEITGKINGGYSGKGDAANNEVRISGGEVNGNIFGGRTEEGVAFDNTTFVGGGKNTGDVNGGYSLRGGARGNTVDISGGFISGTVRGAFTGYGDVTGNTVIVRGGEITKDITGGYNYAEGRVIGNAVHISSGTIGGIVRAGWAFVGDATDNLVAVSGGKITGNVYGGLASKNSARGNTATVSGGEIAGNIYGGRSDGERSDGGDAINNAAHVSSGTINGYIHGGWALYGNVTDNTVTVGGGAASGFVYGGYTENGGAAGNKVIVRDAEITGGVAGGYSLRGGARGSTVDISGGIISGYVHGAAGTGDVTDNTVTVRGGAIGRYVAGGRTKEGNAANNTVTVSGGEITGDVYGGHSALLSATDNTVTVSGGEIGGKIYGGHAINGAATNNTVNINGAPTLASAYIYGGYGKDGGNASKTGNTLNFKNSGTIKAAGVGNFEFYNFWLPADTANEDKMLLAVDSVEVGGSRVEVLLNGESVLRGGDKIALITSAGTITGEILNDKSLSMLGTTVIYEFDIDVEDNVLWAKLPKSGSAAPESGALTDSRLVSVALLAQAADMAAALEYMDISRDKTDSRYVTFAAVNGGSSAYDIGADSEFDVDSFLLIAGVMWDAPVRENSLVLSAFAEAGWGGCDTKGSYGGSLVRGSGDSNYYGAGLNARYQWTGGDKPGGLYADASLRAGRIEADFTTADMKNSMGTHARYDTSSAYYSAHAGIGHIWRLGGKISLDFSSKYLWTRLKGDTFTMATGDRVELGSADSRRWRTGFRAVYDSTEDVSLFFGAYYEYEFDGETAGRVYGAYDLEKASLSGGTGIGEFGVIFRPASNDRFSALLCVQGYAGAREGFSGRLKLQYNM